MQTYEKKLSDKEEEAIKGLEALVEVLEEKKKKWEAYEFPGFEWMELLDLYFSRDNICLGGDEDMIMKVVSIESTMKKTKETYLDSARNGISICNESIEIIKAGENPRLKSYNYMLQNKIGSYINSIGESLRIIRKYRMCDYVDIIDWLEEMQSRYSENKELFKGYTKLVKDAFHESREQAEGVFEFKRFMTPILRKYGKICFSLQ